MSAAGNRGQRPWHIDSGFTLLEMLVIVAILSLVTGIIFPSLDRAMRRQDFANSCARLELALRTARAVAIRSDVPVRFKVSADGHGFSYGAVSERLPDTTKLTGPDRDIAFFADGSAMGGTIAIADRGLMRRWSVRPSTGAIGRVR